MQGLKALNKTKNQLKRGMAAALMTVALAVPGQAIADDEPDMLTIAAGYFDFNNRNDPSTEFRLDYRFGEKFWIFKPFLTTAVVTNDMTFLGGGLLVDIYFGNRWVLTPQTSVTWWRSETDSLDLGHGVEFRSRLELAYRFDDRSRLGVSIDHSSNAGLGDRNPGTESVMLNYSIPTGRVFDLFR